jgi:SecD/SecF fusion protein
LEIIIPEVEQSEVEQVKDIIRRQGALEFRILANRRTSDHKSRIERAEASPAAEVVDTGPDGRKVVAKWVAAGGDVDARENNVVRQSRDGKTMEVLVLMDPFDVTGQYLHRASEGVGPAGDKAIDFLFNSQGSQRFGALTGKNIPDPHSGVEQRLGIVLDNTLISAPNLKSQIREQGQITGINNEREIKTIIDVLNAGSLPTALNKTPIQEQRISAQLGADTIRQGSFAMLIASAVVLVFMVFYYHFAGLVADGAVILNLVLVIALMILIKAAFTLPGLAGLVLTVGMAVDANVLIYERMREEQQRGASLRMSIRNGFSRAMSTIIDSNVTTIATGVVLYAIGTDQIKGFAVTLILGLLVSMFTAVYVARVVFDIAERKRWITRLSMLQWFKESNIDFVGYMKPASILSIIVIGGGLIGVIARGKDLLDIDFTGGSAVQIAFHEDKPQDVAKVREAVAELPDVTVSTIGTKNLEFKIDTSERDLNVVRSQLKKSFGHDLLTYSMSFGEMKPYQLEKVESAAESEKSATPKAEEEPGKTPQEEPKSEAPSNEAKPAAPATEPAKEEKPAPDSVMRFPAGSLQPRDLGLIAAVFGQADAAEDKPAENAAKDSATPKGSTPATAEDPSAPTATEATQAAEPKAEQPATDKPADAAPAADQPVQQPASDIGTSVELTFPEKINYTTLHDRIRTQLANRNLAGTHFELTNPEYTLGSDLRHESWTLNLMLPENTTRELLTSMKTELAEEPVFPAANEIGGKVAGKTQLQAIYAVLASLVIIVLYVWVRFQNLMFGFASVLALVHDVLVAIGFLALSYWMANNLGMEALLVDPFKVSLAVVAALLTIVGFSINDTIVIFDRIREIRGKSPELTGPMINRAVNETLSRTFITSGTVFLATLILYVMGGPGIHPFAYTMLIGVISGTYSTVFVAAPILLWLKPAGEVASSRTPSKSETVGSGRS